LGNWCFYQQRLSCDQLKKKYAWLRKKNQQKISKLLNPKDIWPHVNNAKKTDKKYFDTFYLSNPIPWIIGTKTYFPRLFGLSKFNRIYSKTYSCKFDSSGIGFVYPIQPFWGSLLVTYETGGVLSALQFPPPSIKVSDTIWLKDCLYLLNLMLHWCICYLGPSRFWSYGSWIYKFICNQCLSPLTLWVRIPHRRYVLDATLCDKVCQWLEYHITARPV
jgi:hypothetical protein